MRELSRTHVVVMDRFWGSSVAYKAARANGPLPESGDASWEMPHEICRALKSSPVLCLVLQLAHGRRANRWDLRVTRWSITFVVLAILVLGPCESTS